MSGSADLVGTATSNAEARNEVEQLAGEQAALRRVATLVAREASPEEIYAAVAEEVAGLLMADRAAVGRYEPDGSMTITAYWSVDGTDVPVGTRIPLEGDVVTASVRRSGRPLRIESFADLSGPLIDYAREVGREPRSTIGAPVLVEGQIWGIIFVSSMKAEPFPDDAESRVVLFTELVAMAIANAESRDSVGRLVDEQAALRRVATLVAAGAGPDGVFPAVAAEVDRLFGADVSAIVRFEEGGEATVLGDVGGPHMSGKRVVLDPGYVVDRVRETHHSARFDTDDPNAEDMPSIVRAVGIRSAVASPIVVDGEVWGAITSASVEGPLPAGAERRLSEFTELVATAVSNTQAQAALRTAAEEQGALRRVATLVAASTSPSEVFAAVTREIARVLGASACLLCRADDDGVVVVGTWGDNAAATPPGSRIPRGGKNLTTIVLDTGRPGRMDSYDDASGDAAEVAHSQGVRSAVGAPILVEGRLWGLVIAGRSVDDPLPPRSEERLAAFTQLVATAIANTESSQSLELVAAEQAALRRVATLVAIGAPQDEIFNAVAEGVAGALGEELRLVRYEGGDAVVVAESEGPHFDVLPLGTRLPVGGNNALSHVFRTGEPARIDDYSSATGAIAEAVQAKGLRSIVAAPVTVEGRTWGAMIVGTFGEEPVPPGTEDRLGQFAELMATSIANTEARAEIERLAEEQAALRRIATLVARSAEAEEVFSAVVSEIAATFQAHSGVVRFAHDPPRAVLAGISEEMRVPIGSEWELAEGMPSLEVYRTGRSARVSTDFGPVWDDNPTMAEVRRHGIVSTVASPVVVEGRVWGLISVSSQEELPPDTEQRLEKFTELLTTAIANVAARDELIASRARIVAAGDEARRRIERNLHDGTQQRLIALGLDLQRARAGVPEEQGDTHSALEGVEQDLETILADLRELSHGLHPPLLSRLGLGRSLQALARRSPIPVRIDVHLPERPAARLETAVYYVVSEAITNAIKHSKASEIAVAISGGTGLQASIVDDGIGGADPSGGSGLTGLLDRVNALGGRFALESPPRGGTRVSVELPIGSLEGSSPDLLA